MHTSDKPVALKEWAVAVKALREGKQILVMRKGGIVEETRDFQLESPHFYLYPTYEHQKKELMKESHKADIDQTLVGWSLEDTTVPLTVYAEVVEDIQIYNQEQLNRLAPFHIWTDTFAEERLKWKKQNPLHVLLLRAYELEQPLELAISPDYLGCKSWVEITQPLSQVSIKPVLADEEFAEQVQAIKSVLSGPVAAEA